MIIWYIKIQMDFSLTLRKNLFLLGGRLQSKKYFQLFSKLRNKLKEAEGVSEKLKEQDRLDWIQRMSNIQQRIREIV